jgi:hypothetical protein
MSLIDKIQKAHSNKLSDYSIVYTPTAEIIEKIADDYAIDFLYWYCDNGQWMNMNLDVKELLEIYKKERNL